MNTQPNATELNLEKVIKRHIEQVLHMTGYNQSQAARILGLPLSTLRSKMKKLSIETKGERKAVASYLPTSDLSPVDAAGASSS
ncbi:MAG: hypothetical protein HY314_02035 [Acidobacteria bacterium]|nr:hypothetical protein [Acidobacteriota bacterium]